MALRCSFWPIPLVYQFAYCCCDRTLRPKPLVEERVNLVYTPHQSQLLQDLKVGPETETLGECCSVAAPHGLLNLPYYTTRDQWAGSFHISH